MIVFQTRVGIERPIEEVFAYVSDPGNFPVLERGRPGRTPDVRGSEQRRLDLRDQRQLPSGAATNQLEIVASKRPREFVIRASAGPTPFLYRYRFAADNDETVLQLDAEVELPGAAALLPQLGRRAVKKGVEDNFATMKQILETARR